MADDPRRQRECVTAMQGINDPIIFRARCDELLSILSDHRRNGAIHLASPNQFWLIMDDIAEAIGK